jgi:hypothetical protein
VLVGLDEFVVLAAGEVDGELIVEVAVARAETPCPVVWRVQHTGEGDTVPAGAR